jgi:hemerythrin
MEEPYIFEWTEDLEIDNGQIDSDHKQLIDIANTVSRIEDPDNQNEELTRNIQRLYEYVKHHFKREEAFMLALDYPHQEEHKSRHAEIIQMMNETLTNSNHIKDLRDKFCDLMKHWVLNHIKEEDKKLHNFLYRK